GTGTCPYEHFSTPSLNIYPGQVCLTTLCRQCTILAVERPNHENTTLMQPSKPYPTPRNSLTLFLLFALSALSAVALLAACDNGNPSPTPPNGNSQVPIEQASPGLPRGQAVFARYCNSCHPGGGRGA